MRVRVSLVPPAQSLPPASCAVVIDVLRATTTLIVAFEHGASRVLPAATVEEALALRERWPEALLCGERDGRRIAGFDLGNSPFEYTRERVGDRTLIFASTNGSQAMRSAASCRRRVLAACVNRAAAADAISAEREVVLVCSGKLGGFALEDAACAGLLVERLAARGAQLEGAEARLARTLAPRDAVEVGRVVQGCSQGRHLRSLGQVFARDVEFCAGLDVLPRAPEI